MERLYDIVVVDEMTGETIGGTAHHTIPRIVRDLARRCRIKLCGRRITKAVALKHDGLCVTCWLHEGIV